MGITIEKYAENLLLAVEFDPKVMLDSSHNKTREHPSFKELVGLGEHVLPYLFVRLKESPSWQVMMALSHIIMREFPPQEWPVFPESVRGRFDKVRDVWLEWGNDKNFSGTTTSSKKLLSAQEAQEYAQQVAKSTEKWSPALKRALLMERPEEDE